MSPTRLPMSQPRHRAHAGHFRGTPWPDVAGARWQNDSVFDRGDPATPSTAPLRAIWRSDTSLAGVVVSGAVTDASHERLLSHVHSQLGAWTPERVCIDVTRLHVAMDSLLHAKVLVDRLLVETPGLSRRAVLVADDLPGNALGGLFAARSGSRVRQRIFVDAPAAGRWLAGDEGLLSTLEPPPPSVRARLRAHLEHHLRDATLTSAAHHLGCSTRALQRALAVDGSSFREERRLVRLDRAHALLNDPALKLEWIAHSIGFATASHFCAWYRRCAGHAPRSPHLATAHVRAGEFPDAAC